MLVLIDSQIQRTEGGVILVITPPFFFICLLTTPTPSDQISLSIKKNRARGNEL